MTSALVRLAGVAKAFVSSAGKTVVLESVDLEIMAGQKDCCGPIAARSR
jgi:hypothetical protein